MRSNREDIHYEHAVAGLTCVAWHCFAGPAVHAKIAQDRVQILRYDPSCIVLWSTFSRCNPDRLGTDSVDNHDIASGKRDKISTLAGQQEPDGLAQSHIDQFHYTWGTHPKCREWRTLLFTLFLK